MFDADGQWYPDLFGRQVEVYNDYHRALLVSGPRLNGKTTVLLHKVMRHLYEVKGARVAMFSRILKNSKDGGPWSKIQRDIYPEWHASPYQVTYTTTGSDKRPGPKVDGQTRTPYFRIQNAYGEESECMLFSLDVDKDAETRLKEMDFSMIYFSELSKFGTRGVLQYGLPALRMKGIAFEFQQWIADTNPAEEGEASWIYRAFYLERKWSYDEYKEHNTEAGLPVLPMDVFLEFQKSCMVYEWGIRDNPKLDPRQISEVMAACGSDVGMFERLVNGKWVYGTGDASRHFRGVFNRAKHVVGNCDSTKEEDWEYLNPSPALYELITGWDLGDVNHAAVALEKGYENNQSCYYVLEELVSTGQEIPIADFTVAFMEKIEGDPDDPDAPKGLEELAGHKLNLERAWSDQSALEKYHASSDTYDHEIVYAASRTRIKLVGAPKAKHPGGVALRVRIVKTLLKQGRLKVSAHCKYTIQMLENLKKGKDKLNFVVQDENKHVFDALSYALFMETREELVMTDPETVGRRDKVPYYAQIA